VTVVAALAVLSLFGLALVANLVPRQRSVLLPAVPVIGAAVLVVLLHLTSFVVPVKAGVWIALGLAIVALVVAAARARSWRLVPARTLVATALVLAVGAVGAVITLLPSFIAQSPLAIQPTANNDAFYYVSVAQWVLENPVTSRPEIGVMPVAGSDSPAYGPAVESLRLGLRVGQELVHAGVSTLLGVPPVATFSPMLGLYVLLIPGGAWVLGAAFRLGAVARVVLGAVLVTSFSLVSQSLNQNADSLLGIALLPLVLGLCALALYRRHDQPRIAPLWLAAAALAALVGTYTEYVPFLFATLAALTLVGPLAALKTRVLRALGILGISVVLGPVIWFRAVQGLLLAATLSTTDGAIAPNPLKVVWYFLGPYRVLVGGSQPAQVGLPTILAIGALFLALAMGCLFALVASHTRGIAVGVLVAALGAAYIAFRGNEYITGRAVDMVTPLLIITAVLGWASAARWTSAISRRPVAMTLTTLIVAGGMGAAGVGAAVASTQSARNAGDDRVVTADFLEAAEWVDEVGRDDGANVTVAVGTLFEQLWLSDALAEDPAVSYVNLRGDLGYRSDLDMVSYWDGQPDRFVLVGPGAYASYSSDAVVYSNTRFVLLDLSRDATVAVPVIDEANWSWVVDPSGAIEAFKDARVQIISSRSSLAGLSLTMGVEEPATLRLLSGGAAVEQPGASGGDAALSLDSVPVVDGLAEVVVVSTADPVDFALVGIAERQ
jgi:hypothetical protein